LKSRTETAAIAPGLFAESQGGKRVYFVESLNPLTGTVKNVFMQSLENGILGLVVSKEGRHTQLADGSRYLVLKKQAPRGVVEQLKLEEISGIGFEGESFRFYPEFGTVSTAGSSIGLEVKRAGSKPALCT
jgi:hypothetical protein